MRIIFLILTMSFQIIYSQNGSFTVNKSPKLDSVIKLKKEINSKIQNLRIQIFNGDREGAKLIVKEYIEFFKDSIADIIYETPNYKVWVGSFYTQIEADKNLLKIRKKFTSAFIFRPEIREENPLIFEENDEIN